MTKPPMSQQLPSVRVQPAALQKLRNSEADDFTTLCRIAGINIATDLRFADLQGVDFGRANLDGADFTGADLSGANLVLARITERTVFDDTTMDDAALLTPTPSDLYSEVPDHDTFGSRIARGRDAIGISIEELSRRVGVKSSTVRAWETDRSQPRANRLSLLAGVLDVSLSWLLHGVGSGPMGQDDPRAELTLQLDRLRRLHRETAKIIAQLERDISRLGSGRKSLDSGRSRKQRRMG